jgi:hypothetical protein
LVGKPPKPYKVLLGFIRFFGTGWEETDPDFLEYEENELRPKADDYYTLTETIRASCPSRISQVTKRYVANY